MPTCSNPHPHARHPLLPAHDGAGGPVCDGRPQQQHAASCGLRLGELAAGRDLADEMVDGLGDLAGRVVIVDASLLQSGTPSFAAQLVARVLAPEGALRLIVQGAPEHFSRYVGRAAAALGVADRLGAGPTA